MRLLPLLTTTLPLVAILSLCGAPSTVRAAHGPDAQYSIRQESPELGSHIRRDVVKDSVVAVNLPYAQLPKADRQSLKSWWTDIKPGDEPPFPEKGLAALYLPIAKAQGALLDAGELYAVAAVGPDGKVTSVRIIKSPDKQMGAFAGQLLLITPFKPAVCGGRPCSMEFPLEIWLKRED